MRADNSGLVKNALSVSKVVNEIISDDLVIDISTGGNQLPYICLSNAITDVMAEAKAKDILFSWVKGAECCDCRDDFMRLIRDELTKQVKQMCVDFNIRIME